jgi:hypothetical protein
MFALVVTFTFADYLSGCRYNDAVTLGVALLQSSFDSYRNAPLHADALEVLSTVYIQRGLPNDFDAAERHASEGLTIREAAHGAKSLEAASVYTVLALAQLRLGRQVHSANTGRPLRYC